MKILRKIVKKAMLGSRYSSETYARHLRAKGCNIGEGTKFFSPETIIIDETRPWLINIGKNAQITAGVTILTHGYDWSVIKGKYGDILGSAGKVTIGDNVFVGVKTTILKGATIGDNVIIGANSLVNKDVPNNVVVAGNPAKVICTLEEYYEKRKKVQVKEATELALEYYKKNNKWPSEQVLREFIFLFEKRDKKIKENNVFNEIGSLVSNYDTTYKRFMGTKGVFDGYDDFIEYCKKRVRNEK